MVATEQVEVSDPVNFLMARQAGFRKQSTGLRPALGYTSLIGPCNQYVVHIQAISRLRAEYQARAEID